MNGSPLPLHNHYVGLIGNVIWLTVSMFEKQIIRRISESEHLGLHLFIYLLSSLRLLLPSSLSLRSHLLIFVFFLPPPSLPPSSLSLVTRFINYFTRNFLSRSP